MKNLSIYRNEDKYVINKVQGMQIEQEFSKLLKRDKYSEEGSYVVRSLYFDSVNNNDFFMKIAENEIRKKIRIRVYNLKDEKCKLEVKNKNGSLQQKISIWIDKEDVIQLIKSNYSVLYKYFKESEDAKFIYKTMVIGAYRPVVMIEYERIAFTYPEFNTRITLDKNIKISETNFNLFDHNVIFTPILNNNVVLEVKYNEELMRFISLALQPYYLNRTSVSKYCMGRPNFYSYIV